MITVRNTIEPRWYIYIYLYLYIDRVVYLWSPEQNEELWRLSRTYINNIFIIHCFIDTSNIQIRRYSLVSSSVMSIHGFLPTSFLDQGKYILLWFKSTCFIHNSHETPNNELSVTSQQNSTLHCPWKWVNLNSSLHHIQRSTEELSILNWYVTGSGFRTGLSEPSRPTQFCFCSQTSSGVVLLK